MADYGASVDIFQSGVTTEPGTANVYAEVRIPAVIRTPSGILVAFVEGRHVAGDDGDIDIVARRSTDGGATWGTAFKVKENGTNTVGNPAPVINGAGHIVLAYIKQDSVGGGNRYPFVTKSTDGGVTWGASIDLTSLRPSGWTWFATGPGHGIRTTSGRLIIPINGNHATSGYHAGCIYSDDDGDTWSISATLSDNTGVRNFNESTIAELPDGTLVMFSRNEGGSGPDRIRSTSTDNGATWGSPGESNMVNTNVEGSCVQHASKLVFSSPDDPDSRHNMVIRTSTNGGTTWTTSHTIWRLEDAAYSDLCITGGNSVGLLYERGTTNAYQNITWVRVPLDQITQVGSATHDGNGETADATSRIANKPTGVQSGDLLLANFTSNSVTVNTPSGWTLYDNDNNGVLYSKLYYKVAGGSEPSTYEFTTGSAGPLLLSITAWRGVDTSDPVATTPVSTNNAGSSEPMTTPTLSGNNVENGRMFYVRASFISSVTPLTFTADSFVEEILDIDQSPTGSNSQRSHCLYAWNHGFEGTAESKPGHPITVSATETNNVAFTFALNAGDAKSPYGDYEVARAVANTPRGGVGAKAVEYFRQA